MDDPSGRPDDSWPRDRPIRWGRVAGSMTWFVIGTAAGAFQLALAIPVLAVGRGWLGVALAAVWGLLTLFAAWSWVRGRWRIVIAPILTALAIFATSVIGGPPPPPVSGPLLTDNPAGVVPGVAYRPVDRSGRLQHDGDEPVHAARPGDHADLRRWRASGSWSPSRRAPGR